MVRWGGKYTAVEVYDGKILPSWVTLLLRRSSKAVVERDAGHKRVIGKGNTAWGASCQGLDYCGPGQYVQGGRAA